MVAATLKNKNFWEKEMEEVMQQEQALHALSTKQLQYLKGLAHSLSPLIQIGKDGISEGLLDMTKRELKTRELLKVKIGNNSGLEKHEAAQRLTVKTNSHLIQLIGKTVVLYKENPNRPKDKKIRLPK